jgi:L-lysine 2,3-aminomutase
VRVAFGQVPRQTHHVEQFADAVASPAAGRQPMDVQRLAHQVADRVLLLADGRVSADGAPAAVLPPAVAPA